MKRQKRTARTRKLQAARRVFGKSLRVLVVNQTNSKRDGIYRVREVRGGR